MRFANACWIVLASWAAGIPGWASAEATRELTVNVAQANNNSPYAFVRVKFLPGEVPDPWSVRFFMAVETRLPTSSGTRSPGT
jgi:hypothetical protein